VSCLWATGQGMKRSRTRQETKRLARFISVGILTTHKTFDKTKSNILFTDGLSLSLSLSLCLDLSFGEGKIPLDRLVYIHNATMLTLHNYGSKHIRLYIYIYRERERDIIHKMSYFYDVRPFARRFLLLDVLQQRDKIDLKIQRAKDPSY
jgi:hypothetical protein